MVVLQLFFVLQSLLRLVNDTRKLNICQIWLNHLMNDHHFSYITKFEKKKKKKTLPIKIFKGEFLLKKNLKTNNSRLPF